MISTGIVRRIDDLGRIVIPREVREKVFGTANTSGNAMEFFYDNDGNIILKSYNFTTAADKLDSIKEILQSMNNIADAQELGLSYGQVIHFLAEIEEIVDK